MLFQVEEGVGIVTLNRPNRLNAVNWELATDLVNLFRDLRHRDEVRTIVLTGAGRAFCSGGDAEWLSGSGDRPLPGLSDPARVLPRYQRLDAIGSLHHGIGRGIEQRSIFITNACDDLPRSLLLASISLRPVAAAG